MEEIWKDVIGFEGIYEVSNKGNVRAIERLYIRSDGAIVRKKEMATKSKVNKLGYKYVHLSNKKLSNKLVHRVVALAFIPNTDNKKCINHKDKNKENNCVDNLEWVSIRENTTHYNLGKSSSGVTGVYYRKYADGRNWRTKIHINGSGKALGRFNTIAEAASAYQTFLKENNITNKYAAA